MASAPGEAPAIDTGALAGACRPERPARWPGRWLGGAEYGAILGFGSEHIEPRPFLGPAVEAQREAFEAACAATVGAGARDDGEPSVNELPGIAQWLYSTLSGNAASRQVGECMSVAPQAPLPFVLFSDALCGGQKRGSGPGRGCSPARYTRIVAHAEGRIQGGRFHCCGDRRGDGGRRELCGARRHELPHRG